MNKYIKEQRIYPAKFSKVKGLKKYNSFQAKVKVTTKGGVLCLTPYLLIIVEAAGKEEG